MIGRRIVRGRVIESYRMWEQPSMEEIERRRRQGWALLNVRNVHCVAVLEYVWSAPVLL